MSEKIKSRIRLIYGICLSVLVVAVGVCFAVSCVAIYKSGARPFTYESIGAQFDVIRIPVFICLGAIIGGFALAVFMPSGKKTLTAPSISEKLTRLRLRREMTDNACREVKYRRVLFAVGAAIWTLCAVPSVIYMLNTDNFYLDAQNPNPSIIAFMKLLLPCVTVALGVGVVIASIARASVLREIAALEAAPKREVTEKPKKNTRVIFAVRAAVLVIAAVFIVIGALNGGLADVLAKAIAICTECIGLG